MANDEQQREGTGRSPGGERGAAASARLRVVPGGGTRARAAGAAMPREVKRRLTRLERRVTEALASSGLGAAERSVRPAAVADRALALLAEARRRGLGDVAALLAAGGWAPEAVVVDAAERLIAGLYRYWWRVEATGLERVPPRGRVLLALNRSGALLPYEALMVRAALARQGALGRGARLLVDEWLPDLPVLGAALATLGAVATPAAARRALVRDEALVLYPEGTAATAKPFRDRYRLASFGRGAFARLAIATGTPIVPVAVIGAEEVHPVLARLDAPGRLLGLPTLPLTATFPWLGLAGLVPLPTKWTLLVGEPLEVAARHAPDEARDAAAVVRVRDQVRERLQALVLEGLRRRRAIFRG